MATSDSLNQHLFDPGPARTPVDRAAAPAENSTLFDVAPYIAPNARGPAPKISTENEPGGFLKHEYQLPMFMTPREIHEKYQPLDADRHESYDVERTDTRAGEVTSRSERTDYVINRRRHSAGTDEPGYRRNSSPVGGGYGEESDEQLWDRKYDEASYEYGAGGQHGRSARYINQAGDETSAYASAVYHPTGQPRSNYTTGGQYHTGSSAPPATHGFYKTHYNEPVEDPEEGMSLADSIASSGVRSPIRLGETIGSKGKPEVVGGHHRLAVATYHNPNELVPVLHHRSISDAKRDQTYKYT